MKLEPAFVRLKRLFQSRFALNVGGLMALTALGQSIYLATAPLLGRLYSPEAFGLYGLFYTFIVTASLFTSMNYDLAIPAACEDGDARMLADSAMSIALVMSPVLGLGMMGLIHWNVAGFGALPLWSVAAAVAILLVQAVVQIMQSWRVRSQQTLIIGHGGVSLNLVRGSSQVILGFAGGAWWGLGFGELTGRIANAVHLASKPSGWRPRVSVSMLIPRWSSLKRFKQFPLVLLPSQALDSVVMFIQISGLTFLFGPVGLGQYFLMRRTLDLPVAFVFRSLGDVFYARLADHARNAPALVRPFYVRSFVVLFALGLIGGAPLMLFGPTLFRVVFGEAWGEAGLLAAVMTPSAIMNLAVAPASRVFALSKRPALRYVFTLSLFLGTVVVLFSAWRWELSLVGVTAALSAAISISYFAYFLAGVAATGSLVVSDPDDCKV
jgi:O-antigen/teichoic acid export membrane protein